MSLDSNVIVNVTADSPPVTGVNFGTPALAGNPGSFGGGFTERVRYYSDAAGVAADLASGDILTPLDTALNAALSQPRRCSQVALIRLDAGATPQQVTFTVAAGPGVIGEVSRIRIEGLDGSYTALALDTAADVAAGLRAALTIAIAALDLTVSGAGANIIITGDTVNDLFSYYGVTELPFTISHVVNASGLDLAASLDAARATPALAAWYAFTLQSRADAHQLSAAAWAGTNRPILFIGQSASEDIPLAASTTDLASQLKALAYKNVAVMYKVTEAQWTAFSWLSFTLEADPDAKTTVWVNKTLTGSTIDVQTATEKTTLDAKNCNYYTDFKGQGSTGQGVLVDGQFIDVLISEDWIQARLEEDFATLLLLVSNRNEKIPGSDAGIAQVTSKVQRRAEQGVAIGHFNAFTITAPLNSERTTADKAARLLRIGFVAELTGAIQKIITDGFLVLELPA